MIDREKIEEEIKQVAYEIYVNSGCIPGRDIDNWIEAERRVLEKYGLIKNGDSYVEKRETSEKPKKRVCKRTSSAKKEAGKNKKKSKKS